MSLLMNERVILVGLIIVLGSILLVGCSSPNSNSTTDYILCWLRPSCLPSSMPANTRGRHEPAPGTQERQGWQPTQGEKRLPRVAAVQTKPQQSSRAEHRLSGACHTIAWAEVKPDQSFLTVQYREPSTQRDGTPLKDLAKTTIYKDLGTGFVKVKDIPASSPSGGGIIKETIPLDSRMKQLQRFKICVTATDRRGLEN